MVTLAVRLPRSWKKIVCVCTAGANRIVSPLPAAVTAASSVQFRSVVDPAVQVPPLAVVVTVQVAACAEKVIRPRAKWHPQYSVGFMASPTDRQATFRAFYPCILIR